jgi:hypothetical protein
MVVVVVVVVVVGKGNGQQGQPGNTGLYKKTANSMGVQQ